jgi:AbiU2
MCRAHLEHYHNMSEKLTLPERVKTAKKKTKRVVDHLLYLLELHENNAIVLYSPTLSSQIPASYAANAFNVFQRGLHQFEIVRLCALWDGADLEKENIPTIIELIDHNDVIESLVQETESHWRGDVGCILNPSDDPDLHALVIDMLKRSNANDQAQKARIELRKAIQDSRTILKSPRLQGIMNLRDKHLAHSLSHTRREKAGPIAPMKYGDEREVLNATLPIVEALYCWVNGCSFLFKDSRDIDRENAGALWNVCSFNIVS